MLSHAHWYLKGFFLFPPHPLSSSFHFFKNDEKWILLLLFSFFCWYFFSFYLLLFLKYFELYMKWGIHLGWCMYIYSGFKTTRMRTSNIYLVALWSTSPLTNYLWNFRVSKFCEAQWRLFLFMLVHNFMLFEFELHIGRYTCIQNPHNSNQLSKKDFKKILYGMFYSEILFFSTICS